MKEIWLTEGTDKVNLLNSNLTLKSISLSYQKRTQRISVYISLRKFLETTEFVFHFALHV